MTGTDDRLDERLQQIERDVDDQGSPSLDDSRWLQAELRDARAEIERLDVLARDANRAAIKAMNERDDARADRDQSRKAQMLLAEVANEEAVKSSYTIDKLRAELADARAEIERLTIRVETQEQLYDELRDERAELWPKAQVLPEVERQLAAERAKVQRVEALCGVRIAGDAAEAVLAALAGGQGE